MMSPLLSFLVILRISFIYCHIVGDKAHVGELKKLCEHAYSCFHDTVIICGKSVNEARTFLDLCDMYEYSCEYNMDRSLMIVRVVTEGGKANKALKRTVSQGQLWEYTGRCLVVDINQQPADEYYEGVMKVWFPVFRHVKEDEGVCPNPKELGVDIG